MTRNVRIANGRLLLDDVPSVVLCASLFYFRIPPEQWAKRLAAVKRLGYHAIDVYIPWNFHEQSPGEFSFDGARDVGHFLKLAAVADLLVLARPGPYICSEYDGGGFPAWLGTVEGLRLRQNEPKYLGYVNTWFERVLPILAAEQVHNGGALALLQIENELDFFGCDDPAGYLVALRDMAQKHGVTVPIVACAGQGDLERATGRVEGVVPAANLYPDDESINVEAMTGYYAEFVNNQGFPLLVTETNRLHRTLKRELAAGAVLLGPYLQASGWNFDYAASAGNWGDPLGLMASDYDFGGAISPDGSERPDASEGRILSRIVDALGPRLGGSTKGQVPPLAITPEDVRHQISTSARALAGGGTLLGITNLSSSPAQVAVSLEKAVLDVRVEPGQSLLLPVRLPLDALGIAGSLVTSDREIVEMDERDGVARLSVYTVSDAEVHLALPVGWRVLATHGDLQVARTEPGHFVVDGSHGAVALSDGLARLLVSVVGNTEPTTKNQHARAKAALGTAGSTTVTTVDAAVTDVRAIAEPGSNIDRSPRHMEHSNIFRGGALYSSSLSGGHGQGLVLGAAGDIVTLFLDGVQPQTTVNGGNDLYIEFGGDIEFATGTPITVRAEIWGHSNFHDERLPSLRLGSLRGISSAALVTATMNLEQGWTLSSSAGHHAIGAHPAPLAGWGGWSSSNRPETVSYRRTVRLPNQADAVALRAQGTESVHDVFVEDQFVGQITPLSPILGLSHVLDGACTFQLEVKTVRNFSERLGSVDLLIGEFISGWETAGFGVANLLADADRVRGSSKPVELPLTVKAGEARWLQIDTRNAYELDPSRDVVVRTRGDCVRLTFLNNGHIIGRTWTESPTGAPITGGRGDIALAPSPWLKESPTIDVLVEGIGPGCGTVQEFSLSHEIDRIT